jgi:hypothetical protein
MIFTKQFRPTEEATPAENINKAASGSRFGGPHHLDKDFAGLVGASDFAEEVDAGTLHAIRSLQTEVKSEAIH